MGSTLLARRAGMKQASSAAPTRSSVTPPKVSGSVAVRPKSSDSTVRVRASEPVIPNRHPNEDRAQSLAQDHPQNVAGGRPESDTHANLPRAAADRIGHHAKHPYRCEQQRGDSEESDENNVESPRAQRGGIDLRKRPEPRRNLRVELLQDSSRCR